MNQLQLISNVFFFFNYIIFYSIKQKSLNQIFFFEDIYLLIFLVNNNFVNYIFRRTNYQFLIVLSLFMLQCCSDSFHTNRVEKYTLLMFLVTFFKYIRRDFSLITISNSRTFHFPFIFKQIKPIVQDQTKYFILTESQ